MEDKKLNDMLCEQYNEGYEDGKRFAIENIEVDKVKAVQVLKDNHLLEYDIVMLEVLATNIKDIVKKGEK